MLGRSLNTPQRPPLNPLANNAPGLPLNTMKVPDTSPAARPPISVASSTIQPPSLTNAQHTICKRHNPEISSGVVENENAPFSLQHKRQRTKSGSDSMEPLVPSQDNNSAISPSDCNSGLKGEAMPLCEHNARTTRLEGQELGPQNLEPSCSCTKRDLSSGSSSSSNNNSSNNGNCSNLLIGENMKSDSDCVNDVDLIQHSISNGVHSAAILKGEGNNGGLSPHCAATLEYVTQLPEGCCGVGGPGVLAQPPTLGHEGDDLEDDDNYLDSSEEEVEDEFIIINNEDEESCGEDDQSVISCVTVGSTCSLRSVASEALHTICINENGLAANEDGSLLYADIPAPVPLPSFSPSLFSHVPPAINFCQYNEKTQDLPLAIGRQLKWRFTNITPLIVKKTVANSGYKITKKTLQWCGTWGKHMKSPCFKTVREFQKMNHFPGTFQIGRKDKLWKNFARLQGKFGKEEFGFIPKTFVLPGDLKALKAAFDKEGVKKKWIVKPPASARGTGIQVVHKWSQVPTDSSVVVQRYISRPYLINDTKFDMRIYVLITSFHPLRIYLYQDGLVRFASVQYNKASTSLGDRFMHLTNYSINKTSSSYTHNVDAGQCQGHKWTLKSLWGYLKARGVDTSALWSRVADLVIKTVISGESDIVVRTRRNVRSRYSCYELFGFDVILDERLRPWLLEVNISPSLHSASPLDHSVKGPLIADLLNIAAFHIPDKLSQQQQTSLLGDFSLGEKVSGLCLDRRLYTRLLTAEEQSKHVIVNGQTRSEYLSSVLDSLTPDDVRHLLTSEDEMHRAGKFTRIFPTSETHQYFGFMEKPRYYNRLMDAWENTYSNSRDIAVERLESLCVEKYHLRVPQTFKMPKTAILPPTGEVTVPSHTPRPVPAQPVQFQPVTAHPVESQPTPAQPLESQPVPVQPRPAEIPSPLSSGGPQESQTPESGERHKTNSALQLSSSEGPEHGSHTTGGGGGGRGDNDDRGEGGSR